MIKEFFFACKDFRGHGLQVRTGEILNQDIHNSSPSMCNTFIPGFDLSFILEIFVLLNMILNEKRRSRNTLDLVFDCTWEAGIYCGTTTTTSMLHL